MDNSEHPEADGCHYSTQHDQVAEEVQVEQGQYLSESSRRDHLAQSEWVHAEASSELGVAFP